MPSELRPSRPTCSRRAEAARRAPFGAARSRAPPRASRMEAAHEPRRAFAHADAAYANRPPGDSALVVQLGESVDETTFALIRAACERLWHTPPAGVRDVVPGF